MTWTQMDKELQPHGVSLVFESFIPFPAAPQTIPEVWLSGRGDELLCWRPGGTKLIASFGRLLYDFLNLKDAKGVLQFAEKYGPLYLCEAHERPVMHLIGRALCKPRIQKYAGELELSEPVSAYIKYSRWAGALLKAGDKARTGKPISADEWAKAGLGGSFTVRVTRAGSKSDPPSPLPFPTHGIEAKRMVAGMVNFWLTMGDPRPRLALRADSLFEVQFESGDHTISGVPKELERAAAQLGYGGLIFAALAMQLVSAVSGGVGLATCSSCGVFFVPKRTPAANRRQFCPQCGQRAAWRLSKQAARRK